MINDTFISADARARITMILLGSLVLLGVVAMLSSGAQLILLNRVRDGQLISDSEINATDIRERIIGIVQLIGLVATYVCFCLWKYRAYDNLPHLGVSYRSYASGWAVGAYFVPFMNLVRPFTIMKEIWHGSQPEAEDPSLDDDDGTPALLVGWWSLWLLSNAVGQLVFRMSLKAETVDAFVSLGWVTIVSCGIDIASAVAAILVVKQVNERQQEKWFQIQNRFTPVSA